MSLTLDEIPLRTTIVDQMGAITLFFRLRWEQMRERFTLTPTVASYSSGAKTAAIVTTTLFTTQVAGLYRIALYGRVTIPDGVASSWQATIGYLDGAVALTHVGANVNGDTTTSLDKFAIEVYCDANSTITLATTYTSTTPARMTFKVLATVEQLG